MENPLSVAIQWHSFGPYHLARLNAAYHQLKAVGISIVGLETATQDATYAWRRETDPTAFERYVVFPDQEYTKASFLQIWQHMRMTLDNINPTAVVIAGYSTFDALFALLWCKLHGRSAIMMSDSKLDDFSRSRGKELVKRWLVHQYDSALCAGKSHRQYLEILGMPPQQIFDGLDVVDNEYFKEMAEAARQNPDLFRHLPGLASERPFFLASSRFIKRKNMAGLLKAFAYYRCQTTPDQGWRLVILGDGIERASLESLIISENIPDVSLAGFRQIEELPAYYGLASVFIHPAYQDQWGLVVNEAMAAGLPVLVSNTCGCAADLVKYGENGFTFSPENVHELAELMIRVSSTKTDTKAMGISAQKVIDEWGLMRFVNGLYFALKASGNNF
jgi:glycosyltransferase involved in cell wall biosynthesis